MAQLAETLMDALATPTDHAPSKLATLPDIITSSTPHTSHTSHTSHQHPSHPRPRKHPQHTLRKFMTLDLGQLQQESRYVGWYIDHPMMAMNLSTAPVVLTVTMRTSSSGRRYLHHTMH